MKITGKPLNYNVTCISLLTTSYTASLNSE